MSELAATAERLRVVKDACLDFITLWALDRLVDENGCGDRLYADLASSAESPRKKISSFLLCDRRMDD